MREMDTAQGKSRQGKEEQLKADPVNLTERSKSRTEMR